MRRISKTAPCLIFSLALGGALGCTDQLPTLSGEDRFPAGLIPTTLEHVVPGAEFLVTAEAFTGDTGTDDATFLMVARDFDGDLNARVIASFTEFPDTIVVETLSDGDFTYLEGRVTSTIADTLAATGAALDFGLWTVEQPWDSAAVSWEFAVDREDEQIPWETPGGTRGALIETVRWVRADTAVAADSLSWNIPGSILSGLAEGEIAGLMVTVEDEGGRADITPLQIEASILPTVVEDTIVTRTFTSTAQTFIFTPEAPEPPELLRVGGLTSDRSLLVMDLDLNLPVCVGGTAPSCSELPLDDLALNRVELLLDPEPIPLGFRPVAPLEVQSWQVAEPELADRAPLVTLRGVTAVPGEQFTPGGGEPVALNLTSAVNAVLAENETALGIALLVNPEASTFGYGWFAKNARLRFVYTLPQTPQLP